jgi:hypothetical protein
MEIIPQLISRYSVVLYAVCGIACIYFLFTGMVSLRELRRAVFRLERNAVVSRAISAIVKAGLCLGVGGAVFVITMLAPSKTASGSLLAAVTTTPGSGVVPTSMPTAVITSGQALASVSFTPTITFMDASGNPPPTLTSDAAATAGSGIVTDTEASNLQPDCTSNNAQITHPASGEKVVGAYTIRGTAAVEVGGWYKLEILMPGTVQWAMIGRGDNEVTNGVLFENFNAGNFAPGVYPFRLVLVGADGGIRAVCRIPLTIGS